MMNAKRQYIFGECIPESIKVYNRLKKEGYKPVMVEGWVEVNDKEIDLLPDFDFMIRYFPDMIKDKDTTYYYENYISVFQHTWIEVNRHRIDITKNQFDIYKGIKEYYEYERYYYKGGIETIAI